MTDNANYPKRLIEVDLPIKRISAHARREKSIRHGHISTLHIWWARRPLAACRAVICAALWPDPADPLCPESFREKAKELMRLWVKDNLKLASQESFTQFTEIQKNPDKLNDNKKLRTALLDFIADFANWDNSTNKEYLETSRALTQSAHESLGGEPGTRPLVVDPFAGGGAIPLEALRVGADAFASDLNPVAVLLNKVVLEYIPKYGQRLADEVRKWGQWVKEEAEKELGEFYPKDPDGATPIAYLWARTVQCEGPGCGATIPLIRSLWLARKGNRSTILKILPNVQNKEVDFQIIQDAKINDITEGTIRRGSIECPMPMCGFITESASVKQQLKKKKGGVIDARLLCVITVKPNLPGRFYRLPTNDDLIAIKKASQELENNRNNESKGTSLVPDEPYPDETASGALSTSVLYGLLNWGALFSDRQILALVTLSKLLERLNNELQNLPLKEPLLTCLALAIDKVAQYNSSLCRWKPTGENLVDTFGRQALPMVYDFAETNIFGGASGDFEGIVEWIVEALSLNSNFLLGSNGLIEKSCATKHLLPDSFAQVFFTDPPYYDAIAYGDLSDFFYVWLKRSLKFVHPSLFTTNLVDKTNEIVHLSKRFKGPYSHKTKEYFEKKMTEALSEGKRVLNLLGIGVVVFAHKSTSGWEAQLQAMIDSEWCICGSWPIDTEMGTRMNAMGTASLASSIHLVCRPRNRETPNIGDWRDVLQELPKRIHEWMPRLAAEGVVGADAIFACLGPALEIFSRYSRVEKASGEQVKLKDYLEHVWAAVAKEALNMIFTDADVTEFEEDARLTAMWLWTLTAGATGSNNSTEEDLDEAENEDDESDNTPAKPTGFILEFDAARKIAQGLGAHLENLTSLIEIKKDKARLLPVFERSRYLFGKQEEKSSEKGKKRTKKDEQLAFNFLDNEVLSSTTKDDKFQAKQGTTVLDRIHQSMLLFSAGRSEALKRFLVEDGVGQDQRFWRLAQALSALYPTGTDEKRWVDGVLARKKGLGF